MNEAAVASQLMQLISNDCVILSGDTIIKLKSQFIQMTPTHQKKKKKHILETMSLLL